jgi:hypothetical protein
MSWCENRWGTAICNMIITLYAFFVCVHFVFTMNYNCFLLPIIPNNFWPWFSSTLDCVLNLMIAMIQASISVCNSKFTFLCYWIFSKHRWISCSLETIYHLLRCCCLGIKLIKYSMIMSAGGGNTGVHLSTPWTTFPFSGRVIVVWLFP